MRLHLVWRWFADHWKLWGIPSVVATITSMLMFIKKWRKLTYELKKARQEAEKARLETELARKQAEQYKLALETQADAQLILIFASTIKQKPGYQNFEFSEEILREALGDRAPWLHAVMELLRDQGKARKSVDPGYWIID